MCRKQSPGLKCGLHIFALGTHIFQEAADMTEVLSWEVSFSNAVVVLSQ